MIAASTQSPLPSLVLREAGPDDRGFIAANFVKSAQSVYAYRNMHIDAWRHHANLLLDQLLERSQAVVLCDKEKPTKLLGFAIAERPFKSIDQMVLHFAYVKHEYRQRGLCTAMLKSLGHDPPRTQLFATHMTVAWFHIGAKYGAVYNPFFVWPQFHTEKDLES